MVLASLGVCQGREKCIEDAQEIEDAVVASGSIPSYDTGDRDGTGLVGCAVTNWLRPSNHS